tara:strand:- start:1823 stop:2107 length:285 start_codon:yes stop_codon:yes gene_type:complete
MDKSWPHAVIAFIVMLVFTFIIPEMPKVFYAGLIPIVYFYGREVRDAESALGLTTFKYLNPLIPWLWKNKDNRMDFYLPVFAVGLLSVILMFFP